MVYVKAVYEDGQLRLLEPVNLNNGDEIGLWLEHEPEARRELSRNAVVQLAKAQGIFADDLLEDEDSFSFPYLPPDKITPQEQDRRIKIMWLAGVLLKPQDLDIPEDAQELTEAERDRLGRLFASTRPVEDLIDEDRGEY
jgi:predicted DNA-binding antitoxin AbrB/MazE fold protein